MNKQVLDEKPLVFTIDNFYTKEQCEALIKMSEDHSYSVAPITVGHKEYELQLDNRNNDRVIIDDIEFAKDLFNQLEEFFPYIVKGWYLSKLNNRFRYYRYTPGQKFEMHIDGRYRESIDMESKLTFLLYLSDGIEGGETAFFDENEQLRFKVNPKAGQVLVFDHAQLHSGEPVLTGAKYVLRSDVMYSRFDPAYKVGIDD